MCLDKINIFLINEIDFKILFIFIFLYLRKLVYYLEIIKIGKYNIYYVIWLIKKLLFMC